MKTGTYNIVFNLPAAARRQAITTSKRLRKKGGVFALGEKIFIPHVSVYLIDIPQKNEKKIVTELKKLAEKSPSIKCTALRYWNLQSGYVGILYRKTKAIGGLQKNIISAINPLRENAITERDRARLSQLSAIDRKNIQRFGYSRVGIYYHPHVTLSKFAQGEGPSHEKISKKLFSFRAVSIGLYQRGDHGSCKKLVASFPLLAK